MFKRIHSAQQGVRSPMEGVPHEGVYPVTGCKGLSLRTFAIPSCKLLRVYLQLSLRGGKVEIRLAHNQKTAGATPASATKTHGDCGTGATVPSLQGSPQPCWCVSPCCLALRLRGCHRLLDGNRPRTPIFFVGVDTTPISCDTVCSVGGEIPTKR